MMLKSRAVLWIGAFLFFVGRPIDSQSIRQAMPEILIQNGHSFSVNCVTFSPDGKVLSSGSTDSTVKLWEASSGRLLSTLSGHSDFVYSVAFSPDGKTLASGSRDKTVKQWDVSSGKLLSTLSGHSDEVNSVAFSPDGKTLASGSRDQKIKLWDTSSGRVLQTLSGPFLSVRTVGFSPDGKTLASGASSDNGINLWDVSSGTLRSRLNAQASTISLAYSPDGMTLASCSFEKWIKVWDASSGKLLLIIDTDHTVLSVAFSPDGKTITSVGYDRTVKLWEASTGKLLSTLSGHSGQVNSVAFSPDGKTLASGSDDSTVKLWETSSGRPIATLSGHSDYVYSVTQIPSSIADMLASKSYDAKVRLWEKSTGKLVKIISVCYPFSAFYSGFSPDYKTIASFNYNKPDEINLWDVPSGNLLSIVPTYAGDNNIAFTFSPDGETLAAASTENTVKLWEISSGRLLTTLSGHSSYVSNMAFSPDGNTLASTSKDATIKLWEASSGNILSTLSGHSSQVNSVAFSPDNKTLASGSSDTTLKLWTVASGRLITTLSGHSDEVLFVAFSPDGKSLASYSKGATVKLWETSSGRLLSSLAAWFFGFTPDGKTLASGGEDNTMKLWDVASGRLLSNLSGHTARVTSFDFSPDGKTLASGSEDNTMKLWDVASGRLIITLSGHAGKITSIRFNPDGKTLITSSADTTIKYWDVSTGKCLATFIAMDESDYIVYTDDGYFDCSPGAAKYVTYKVGNQVYGLDQYEAVYRRPDIIAQRLGGQVSEYVAKQNQKKSEAPKEFVVPPTAVIMNLSGGDKLDAQTTEIRVRAVDPKYPISSIMVKVNDRPIPGSSEMGIAVTDGMLSVTRAFKDVPLVAGDNKISVCAYNKTGIRSDYDEIVVTVNKKLLNRTLYFLALAIDDYPAGWTLKKSVADAKTVEAAVLSQKGKLFADVKTRLLLNKDATNANFSVAVNDFIGSQALAEDIVMIYLAGHGKVYKGTYYYITADADPAKTPYLGLKWENFQAAISDDLGYINKVVIVNDTCYSAALTRGEKVDDADLFRELAQGSGVFYISSTSSQEQALDGQFAGVLVEGIRGGADANGDGKVTMSELGFFVETTVPKRTAGQMHPQIRKLEEGDRAILDFPISVK